MLPPNIISLSHQENVWLILLRFEIYFSHLGDERRISQNLPSLSILVYDLINELYYEH